ncbi:hypothetical protein QLX78_004533 [Salmonella enterica]|nr:hypothetical protein [Salmonella enterica]ECY5283356.1 hypothetical protein [Salmonella enterica subsp. enterica serovar Oranienburg]EEH4961068.1 hypothetical protein [Salmonella enterica subsp. enterica serovar Javiana]EBL8960222.1 hypothetical protein [Salmonella enterica]EBO4503047.1 hypothetical protein [Salmonella enterica]
MARLVKNIDTLSHGPLRAGRLLNGLMDEEKISELIASGHAEPTEDDGSIVLSEKVAENASGESESLFERAFLMGYAFAVNDAVDEGLISAEEAGTCIFDVSEIDTDIANTDINAGVSGGENTNLSDDVAEEGIKPEKALAKVTEKGKKSKA